MALRETVVAATGYRLLWLGLSGFDTVWAEPGRTGTLDQAGYLFLRMSFSDLIKDI